MTQASEKPDTYKIWSKEFQIDSTNNTVTLPGQTVVRLDDYFALMYVLLLKGNNESIADYLGIGKDRYLSLFKFIPRDSMFMAMKEDKLAEMESGFLEILMRGGSKNG